MAEIERLDFFKPEETEKEGQVMRFIFSPEYKKPYINPILRRWKERLLNQKETREKVVFALNKNTPREVVPPYLDMAFSAYFIYDHQTKLVYVDIGLQNSEGRKFLHSNMRLKRSYTQPNQELISGHIATKKRRPMAFGLLERAAEKQDLIDLSTEEIVICHTLIKNNVLPITAAGFPLT